MHILIAEQVIRDHKQPRTKLSELYEQDARLQEALRCVFPDFNYAEFADQTLEEICAGSPLLSRQLFRCVTRR